MDIWGCLIQIKYCERSDKKYKLGGKNTTQKAQKRYFG